MLFGGADDTHHAAAPYDFAFLTDLFHAGSYFHYIRAA